MLPLFALPVQVAAPPPVPIQAAPVPRAAGTVVTLPPRTDDAPAILDVDVRGAGVTLWSGAMRPTTDTTATFTETVVNAPPTPCAGTVNRYEASYRTSLQLSLRMLVAEPSAPFKLTVSWERPSDSRDCDNLSTETTSKSETFDLAVGQHREITAAGGLEVRITRRR